jgi:hypothetical protein
MKILAKCHHGVALNLSCLPFRKHLLLSKSGTRSGAAQAVSLFIVQGVTRFASDLQRTTGGVKTHDMKLGPTWWPEPVYEHLDGGCQDENVCKKCSRPDNSASSVERLAMVVLYICILRGSRLTYSHRLQATTADAGRAKNTSN